MKGFKQADNVLVIKKDLTSPLDVEFDIACRKLLDSDHHEIVIDLSRVKRIISQYLGALAMAAAEARRSKRTLTVRATGTVLDVIKQVGFDQLMNLEQSEPPR